MKLATKEETKWLQKVNKAITWRKIFTKEIYWPILDKYYQHDFEKSDIPRFNLIYIMGQSLIPNLVFQNPGIINRPTQDSMTYLATIWDSIDNTWIRQCEMRDIAKDVVLSSYLYNTTATQIGYDFGTEADELREKEYNYFESTEDINRSRVNNMPWIDFVPSHRFITSVGTKNMRKCAWAGKLVSAPIKLIKSIKGTKKVAASKLPEEILRLERETWENKNKNGWVHFWQIHDAETKKWFWLSTDGVYILPPQDDPLQVFGLPFEVVSFNGNLRSIFGTPDAEYIKSQQLEGDEVRFHSMINRRQGLVKLIYNSNVIKPEDIERMKSGEPMVAIPANLGDTGEDSVSNHIYAFKPPSSYLLHREYAKDLLNDAQLINGFGPNQMGTFAPGRRTKYETQVVESNNTTRLAYRRHMIANMIQGHTHRANILISKNWTGDLVQQVVGVDGALYWVKVGANKLNNVELGLVTEVNVESLAPASRERRKAEAMNLLNVLGNMQNAGLNTLPLIKQLLSAYEWIDVTQVLPQMGGEYELAHWEQQQRKMVSEGNLGTRAADNLQGLDTLNMKLPSEPAVQEQPEIINE